MGDDGEQAMHRRSGIRGTPGERSQDEAERSLRWRGSRAGFESFKVEGLAEVMAVAAGESHTLALRQDGTVWGWGDSEQGELGAGVAGYEQREPVQVMGLSDVRAL